MFGELIGLWAVAVWPRWGAGRARARRARPRPRHPDGRRLRGPGSADFRAAASVHLVETSPVLRARQRERSPQAGVPIRWHDDLATVPPGPTIVIANEFFDALPIRQFVATERGWCERLVGLAGRPAGLRPRGRARGCSAAAPAPATCSNAPKPPWRPGPSHGASSDMAARRCSSITATGPASATPCRRSRTTPSPIP